MTYRIHPGDCLHTLRAMPDNSVDSIVTDPPYGLSFMGKRWDYDVPSVEIWAECLRVLKPGGHLLAFAGTRTQHRMAVRIEDAGFEIRDMIAWVYGSGFPKSLDVSKAIDKMDASEARRERQLRFTEWMRENCRVSAKQANELMGTAAEAGHYFTAGEQPHIATRPHFEALRPYFTAEVPVWVEHMVEERTVESENFKRREVVGVQKGAMSGWDADGGTKFVDRDITLPATEAARQWQGWGTALKPALEPITVARKPLTGTVADNVLAHGTGALNIDGCRVGTETRTNASRPRADRNGFVDGFVGGTQSQAHEHGRWPANLIHDGSEEVLAGFPSSAARFFKECKQEWQDQGQSQSNVETAGLSLSLQSALESIVQSVAATWQSLAGIVSSDAKGHSTSVTASELESIAGACTAAMAVIASGCLPESRLEKRSLCGSLVSVAATRSQTGITTITASLLRSGGYADHATSSITPTNLDRGEAVSRFNYCAKASKADRDEGLEWFEAKPANTAYGDGLNTATKIRTADQSEIGVSRELRRNIHPTVKPTDLMRYLCRLVTPPKGVVLDPFMGSGSTGKAAMLEGFQFIGCELSEEYIAIARARIEAVMPKPVEDDVMDLV